MKTITIDISPAGDVNMDLAGFKGKSCTSVVDKIKIMIGGETDTKKKPDYFQPDSVSTLNRNRI